MKSNSDYIKKNSGDIISDYIAIFKRALNKAERNVADPMVFFRNG